MERRVLITGGAGFIGSHFVKYVLGNTDLKVTVVDSLTYAGNLSNLSDVWSNIEMLKLDIRSYLLCEDLSRYQYIVNFAANTHVDRSIRNGQSFIGPNVEGVAALLDGIVRSGKQIKFLQVSTDEVYGDTSKKESPSVEYDPLNPGNPYAASKCAAELLVSSYRKTFGLDVMITRGANTYGPCQFPEKLIPSFVTLMSNSKPLPVYGDGKAQRDYLYVKDHCSGIFTVLRHGLSGYTYNISANSLKSINEIVSMLYPRVKKYNPDAELKIHNIEGRPGHDLKYQINSDYLRSMGWTPEVSFEEGLDITVKWYLDNPNWFEVNK